MTWTTLREKNWKNEFFQIIITVILVVLVVLGFFSAPKQR
jgi:hypothetical protein